MKIFFVSYLLVITCDAWSLSCIYQNSNEILQSTDYVGVVTVKKIIPRRPSLMARIFGLKQEEDILGANQMNHVEVKALESLKGNLWPWQRTFTIVVPKHITPKSGDKLLTFSKEEFLCGEGPIIETEGFGYFYWSSDSSSHIYIPRLPFQVVVDLWKKIVALKPDERRFDTILDMAKNIIKGRDLYETFKGERGWETLVLLNPPGTLGTLNRFLKDDFSWEERDSLRQAIMKLGGEPSNTSLVANELKEYLKKSNFLQKLKLSWPLSRGSTRFWLDINDKGAVVFVNSSHRQEKNPGSSFQNAIDTIRSFHTQSLGGKSITLSVLVYGESLETAMIEVNPDSP